MCYSGLRIRSARGSGKAGVNEQKQKEKKQQHYQSESKNDDEINQMKQRMLQQMQLLEARMDQQVKKMQSIDQDLKEKALQLLELRNQVKVAKEAAIVNEESASASSTSTTKAAKKRK